MKSQALPEIPIIGLISTITIAAGILLPPAIIRDTLDNEVMSTYESEKLRLALLTLLSSAHDGRMVYELVAESSEPGSLEFLKAGLDSMIETKCYSLQTGNDEHTLTTILESGSCTKRLSFTTVISLPYNPDSNSRVKLLRIGVG